MYYLFCGFDTMEYEAKSDSKSYLSGIGHTLCNRSRASYFIFTLEEAINWFCNAGFVPENVPDEITKGVCDQLAYDELQPY